jgi:putative transposase
MPQSLSSVLIHLIYSTKNREPLITPRIERELYAYQIAVLRELDCSCIAINGRNDHLHTLFSLSRKVRLCDVIGEIKKRSSKWIKTMGSEFRGFAWQSGYGAFSIGQSSIVVLRRYIEQQAEHHQNRSFQEEYRMFLTKYEIAFDERYVWD